MEKTAATTRTPVAARIQEPESGAQTSIISYTLTRLLTRMVWIGGVLGRWSGAAGLRPGMLSQKGNAWYCGEKQDLASGSRDGYLSGLSLGEGSGELIQQCISAGIGEARDRTGW